MSGHSSSITPPTTKLTTTPFYLTCGTDFSKAELPFILITTLIVNFISFAVLWRMRGTCDSVDHLLVHILNINDLLTTLLFTLTWIVGVASCGRLLLSDTVCGVFGWLGSALVIWSAFIVLIMTGLRCLSLIKPFYYRSHVNSRAVTKVAVGCLGFSILLFLFPFTGKGKPFLLYTDNLICAVDFAPGGSTAWHRAFIGFMGALGMLVIIFVVVCNILIIKTLRQRSMVHASRSGTHPTTATHVNANDKRRVFQRVTLVVSFVYGLCYTPFAIRVIYDTAVNLDHQNDLIHSVSMSLLFLSPFLNPFVYGLFNKGFRATFISMIKCEKATGVTTASS